jgi:hypothetical protein
VAESVKTRLREIEAPYGRRIWFDDVLYESGMRLLRMTIREGARYTIVEVDAAAADAMAETLGAWCVARPNVAP